ncbi:MAG: SusD/RagB family nutrient-binding outer membrane lipoprotein, partial [Cyclobacteriaceae bacterium]
MNKFKKILLAFTMMWAVMACDLDKLDNPNAVSPANSDVDFVLNQVQLRFAGLFFGMSDYGMQMTRLQHFYGPTYEAGFNAQSFDGFWSAAYSGVLINTKTLIPTAEANSQFVHAGIAQVLEAYTLMSLVDYFGDVPYTEALDANNFNPVADDGADVYAAAIEKLDLALANFAKTSLSNPKNDLYYAGDKARWITLAKTLKLRALLQTRLVNTSAKAGIEALFTEGDLIDEETEDFNFKYSTVIANPDSRHPYFIGDYLQGAGYYKSNYLMNEMYLGKPIVDPRIRYYFYRQVSSTTTDVNKLNCITVDPPAHYVPEWPFCAVGDGYWGRDFGDFSGTPPDTFDRTAFGIYPAGGRFDGNFYKGVDPSMGLQGAGILPIYNSANTAFMLAEAALTLGANVGSVKTSMLDGIQRSVEKAILFKTSEVPDFLIPKESQINNYKNYVGGLYDAAASDDERLEVIVKEYWLSLFGNGIDAFNTYRRTGKPGNLQGGLIQNMGTAYRSFT